MTKIHNSIAENVLGTIGAILWSLQLVPQIGKSYRDGKTEGLSSALLLIWFASGIFLGAYALIQRLAIPLLIQYVCSNLPTIRTGLLTVNMSSYCLQTPTLLVLHCFRGSLRPNPGPWGATGFGRGNRLPPYPNTGGLEYAVLYTGRGVSKTPTRGVPVVSHANPSSEKCAVKTERRWIGPHGLSRQLTEFDPRFCHLTPSTPRLCQLS